MSTDPYAPPKAALISKSRGRTLFERASVYQSRATYLGFFVMIGALIAAGLTSNFSQILSTIAVTVASISGFIFAASVFLTLPLSIWGIIDGYREGRKNRRAANTQTDTNTNAS